MTSPARDRVQVVGTGLIGASIGLALRARGWHVSGDDRDPARAERAAELGAVDVVGHDDGAEIVFVATPVSAVVEASRAALAGGDALVTDVGSVKAPIVAAVASSRFVGGHPMAGSEQDGVDGADASLFEGATWVLTPDDRTDSAAFARVRAVVSSLGADVVAVSPERHDDLVAVVSHVPHLTAAALMGLAATGAEEHGAMLRLAAGGFRDMTRVAAGHPGLWLDICAENRVAIVTALDQLVAALGTVRELVATEDRPRLTALLDGARHARINLPSRAPQAEQLVELRVPVRDRPGVLAEVTTLAGQLGVNIVDFEIVHSLEGDRGVLVLVVDADCERLRSALSDRGYRPAVQSLG
ncbi:MAG: prephenate dehydrogenase/arogenate dehydrogenase family protein [Acidimicrobiales bacterium]